MTTVTPRPGSGPLSNPVLEVLHERHPEVDIVVLPDPVVERASRAGRAPAPSGGAAVTTPRTVAETVESLAGALMSRLSTHPAWAGAQVERDARWHRTADGYHHFEAVVTATGLETGDNIALLKATGNALLGLGWLARPVPGDRPRLEARRGPYRASAVAGRGTLVLTVTSGLLAGTADR